MSRAEITGNCAQFKVAAALMQHAGTEAVAFGHPEVVGEGCAAVVAFYKTRQPRTPRSATAFRMAQLTVLYWRDIPSQVIVKAGRQSEKRLLSDRFQEAIDMAAMRGGAAGTDAYLDEWRRADPVEVEGDMAAAATAAAERLEADYDKERLKTLIANGGWAKSADRA
jgi:hypothetical protein